MLKKIILKLLMYKWINVAMRNILLPIHKIKNLKFIWAIPVVGIVKINMPNNNKLLLQTDGYDSLAQNLFWDGIFTKGFEPHTLNVFMDLIIHNNNFIDIGANIGIYSLVAAKLNPQSKIIGIEPVPWVFNRYIKNIQVNDFTNIDPICCALTENIGISTLYIPPGLRPYCASLKKGLYGNTIEMSVPTLTLDSIVKEKNFKPELLKIDTEATEDMIIKGGLRSLEKFKPIIICEILFNQIENKIEKLFLELDYSFFWISADGLKKKKSLIGDFKSKNRDYLFVPNEKVQFVENLLKKQLE